MFCFKNTFALESAELAYKNAQSYRNQMLIFDMLFGIIFVAFLVLFIRATLKINVIKHLYPIILLFTLVNIFLFYWIYSICSNEIF